MKYGDWTLGQTEALLNIVGGAEVARAVLKNESRLIVDHNARKIFATPQEQVKSLLTINEQVWKDRSITEAAIKALGDPPEVVDSYERQHHLWCRVLLSETGNVYKTLKRNRAACLFVHGRNNMWQEDQLVLTSKTVRQRQGAMPRPVGLRWATAELGRCHRGRQVQEAWKNLDASGYMGMGQELPLIAALHPRWATSISDKTIPCVYAPDLEVCFDSCVEGEVYYKVLALGFSYNYGGVLLNAAGELCKDPGAGAGYFNPQESK